MHGSEVRVRQAFNDVRDAPCRSSASARRNHRNNQGDSIQERASAQAATRATFACMKEHVGHLSVECTEGVVDELRGGSDTLSGWTPASVNALTATSVAFAAVYTTVLGASQVKYHYAAGR